MTCKVPGVRVIDPGHRYALPVLDGDPGAEVERQFVKRIGEHYPGNEPPAVSGTIMQHELRVIIDRLEYVNKQIHFAENEAVVGLLKAALLLLEQRAARSKGRTLDYATLDEVVAAPVCARCGHIQCDVHER